MAAKQDAAQDAAAGNRKVAIWDSSVRGNWICTRTCKFVTVSVYIGGIWCLCVWMDGNGWKYVQQCIEDTRLYTVGSSAHQGYATASWIKKRWGMDTFGK